MKLKIKILGYSHINSEGVVCTGPFRTKKEAIQSDRFGYYNKCKIELVEVWEGRRMKRLKAGKGTFLTNSLTLK